MAREDVDDELGGVRWEVGLGWEGERAYGLEEVDPDDAFEGEELEDGAVWLQDALEAVVEFQHVHNGYHRDDGLEDSEPDVGKVDAVGLRAVCSGCKGDDCCEPDDDAHGNELEDAVPHALERH